MAKKSILVNYSRFVVELKSDFHVPLKNCTNMEEAKVLCRKYSLPIEKIVDLES